MFPSSKTSTDMVILTLLVALFSSFAHCLQASKLTIQSKQLLNVCQTEACRDLAQIYVENMDSTANPCNNFYQFACGSAKRLRGKPKTRRLAVHPYIDADDQVNRDLAKLVQDSDMYPADNEGMQILRKYYKSCINAEKIIALKSEPLLRLVQQLGGLPIMGNSSGWIEGLNFDWLNLLIKMRLLGVDFNYFFDFKVAPSLQDNRKPIIYLDQPKLSPSEIQELRSARTRKEAFAKTLQKLGYRDLYSRSTESQLSAASDLATKLLSNWKPAKARAGPFDRPTIMTVQQFKLVASNTDWSKLFSGLLEHPVDETAQIGVSELDYFIELDKQLALANKTDLANFIMLRLSTHADILLPSAYELYHGDMKRPEQCLDLMKDLVPLPLASEYVRNFVSDEAQRRVGEMVALIKSQMIQVIGENGWLSSGSASANAQQKCDAINQFVSHTESLKNGSLVAKLYQGSSDELDEAEFFMNSIRLQKRDMDWSFGRYTAHSNDDVWLPYSMTITTNAFYQAQRNSINILAAIMRGTFFNESAPSYVNFGALGSLIGHEISHAFDSQGIRFDRYGNLNETWWADAEVHEQYRRRMQCFVEQYDRKQIANTYSYVNGTRTMDENMADAGGYKTSYRAYVKWKSMAGFVDDNSSEPLLVLASAGHSDTSMEFDWKKLFWLAAASNCCDNMTPTQTADLASYDEHSPSEFRVNLAMSNEPKFSEAFGCPVGSPMNPVKRCNLW